MEKKHAFLSPSAAHRWMHCTAAPSLEADMPDTSSVYADEGTLAHAIGEAKLRAYLQGTPDAERIYRESDGQGEADWNQHPLYHPEMEDCSDYYRDEVISMLEEAKKTTPDAKLIIEQKLFISEILFGTTDSLIIADGKMNVIDYKHGKGVKVSAKENPQMMIYALGAYIEYSDEYNIEKIGMTIIQPRINNTSYWEISTEQLLMWWADQLQPRMTEITSGKVHHEAGSWCRFCKVRKKCKALANMAEGTVAQNENPHTLTLDEVSALLPKVDTIKQWCEDILQYALEEMLEGRKVPGYKVVEGRSLRKISNPERLIELLKEHGIEEDKLYKPRELKAIRDLQAVAGKKTFDELSAGCITKPKGKPTIAPEDDKRPVYDGVDVASDFGDLKE